MWRVVEEAKQSRSKREDEIIVADGSILGPIVEQIFAIWSRVPNGRTGKEWKIINSHNAICGIVGLKVATKHQLLVGSGRIRNLLTHRRVRSKLHTELTNTSSCSASRIKLIDD